MKCVCDIHVMCSSPCVNVHVVVYFVCNVFVWSCLVVYCVVCCTVSVVVCVFVAVTVMGNGTATTNVSM